jgi:hypothetical protein
MRVFISWSGDSSLVVAKALHSWMRCVLQRAVPFVSAHDLERGARWFNEISRELDATDCGILCLTPHNIEAPWVLFEAGALSKKLEHSRVIPLLVDVSPAELKPPLSFFNAATADKAGLLQVVQTLNKALGADALADDALALVFEKWWPDFEAQLVEAKKLVAKASQKNPQPKRGERELLEEMLALLRGMAATPPPTMVGSGIPQPAYFVDSSGHVQSLFGLQPPTTIDSSGQGGTFGLGLGNALQRGRVRNALYSGIPGAPVFVHPQSQNALNVGPRGSTMPSESSAPAMKADTSPEKKSS